MKNEVLKKVKKYRGKVFTKKKVSNKIRKNYNPLKVNNKLFHKRRDGLPNMKNKESENNDLNLKKIMNMRILKNANLFSEEEMLIIKNNSTLIQKIYMLGILDNI